MTKTKATTTPPPFGQPRLAQRSYERPEGVERRYEIEKVCDRHGVSYHPSTGVGRAQAFIEDLLETMGRADVDRIRNNVDEAVRSTLMDVNGSGCLQPWAKSLEDAIKERLDADTDVRVVDAVHTVEAVRANIERGDAPEPQHCPLCGAPALIKAIKKLGTPLTMDPGVTVRCSDAGPEHGGCTMPPVDQLTWDRFPRNDTISIAAVQAVAKGLVEGWSGDMYENDPADALIDAVMEAVHAAID